MPEETATGARFLRAILPASGGPGPTAGSVDPGLRIAFFRHFGPSRSEVQLHLLFQRTRGAAAPRRPKVHFKVGGDHDQRGWRGPRLRTCEAVRANPQTNKQQQCIRIYIRIYTLYTYVLILVSMHSHFRHRAGRPSRVGPRYVPHGGSDVPRPRGYGNSQ